LYFASICFEIERFFRHQAGQVVQAQADTEKSNGFGTGHAARATASTLSCIA